MDGGEDSFHGLVESGIWDTIGRYEYVFEENLIVIKKLVGDRFCPTNLRFQESFHSCRPTDT